jgi:hypothetical protein
LLDDETGEEGSLKLWSAQERLIRKVGDVEQQMFKYIAEGRRRLDGNCWFVHKRRQTGASTVCQAMGVHRTVLWSNMTGLAASTNEDKIGELYSNYYYFMLERLPRWMQPERTGDTLATGVKFANGSKVILQNAAQTSGLGQGAKWHWAHLTECASWPQTKIVDQIENHFTQAISQSIKGMAFLESTSQGMDDWWHRVTELARHHNMPRWNYFFVPWYAVEEISIDYPPEGWQPKPDTMRHAEHVERTSPEFMDGATVHLTKEQLYFWETKRRGHELSGSLAAFYKNFPATPEESFVNDGRVSFPIEIITWHEANTREPYAYYDLLGPNTPSEIVITEAQRRSDGTLVHPPRIQQFGSIEIGPVRVTPEERKRPLGLIRIWENPDEVRMHDTYAACDTADGIMNWSRFMQKPTEDDKLDRSAVQMFRQTLDRTGATLDVQIGEFFAPISPLDVAPYVVALSMLMHGRNSLDQQPPLIIELTGGGKTLFKELSDRYGWFHFYQHFEQKGQQLEETNKFGYTPTPTSVRQLWIQGKQRYVDVKPTCPACGNRDVRPLAVEAGTLGSDLVVCGKCEPMRGKSFVPIKSGRVIVRSKPLVNEMRICEDEGVYVRMMMRGKAKEGGGRHDDLVISSMLNLWQANLFNLSPFGSTTAPVQMTVGAAPGVRWAERPYTKTEREAYLAEWSDRVFGDFGL